MTRALETEDTTKGRLTHSAINMVGESSNGIHDWSEQTVGSIETDGSHLCGSISK